MEEKEKMLEDLRREQEATELLAAKYKVRVPKEARALQRPPEGSGLAGFALRICGLA